MSFLFGGTPFDGYDRGGQRSLNTGGGGSGGGGQQTSTGTTYQTNIPAYLEDPTKRMVARGETLSEQGYTPYEGERIAGFNPMQTQAFSDLEGMGTPSQFGEAGSAVTGAEQFGTAGALGAMGYQPTAFNQYQLNDPSAIGANQVAGSGYNAFGAQAAPDVQAQALQYFQMQNPEAFGASQAAQYMSPYQQAVTDVAKREAMTEAAMLNRQLSGQAAKAGAFGGSRFGVEQALLGSKLATNLSDIQTKGLQDAYANAQTQFERDRAAQMSAAGQNLQAALGVQSLGAGQNLQAQLANQQMRQQANLASQSAYNEALRFGATQEQAAALANQQANLTAAQSNQQMQYQTGVQNLQSLLQTQQQQDAARQAAANLNLQGAQFGAQTGLSAAERLGQLGSAQQAADLQRVAAQQSAGAQQQALEQQKLDSAYQTAIEQRDWEKNQLGFLSGLVRGTPFSTSSAQTTSAPGATTASQLASLGLGAYGLSSLLGKKEGGAIKGYAKGGKIEGYAPGGGISDVPDQVIAAVVAGKSNVLPLDVAIQEQKRRKMIRTGFAGKRAQETLSELPEDTGIGALPAENIDGFAKGGILEDDDVPRYNGNQEYGSVVYGGIEYPIDPTTGKVLYKGAWTSPSLLSGSAASPWNTVGVKKEPTVQEKADKIASNEQMIADVQAGKGVMKNGSYYPIITEGKNAGKVDYKGIPTLLDKHMFDTTPPERTVKPSSVDPLLLEQSAQVVNKEAPATPAAPPAPAANKNAAAPGSAAAGNVVNRAAAKGAEEGGDFYDQLISGRRRLMKEIQAGEPDPFAESRAQMEEQKKAYQDMRTEGRGLAALQAAAAISQGGPGGTIAQLGRGVGALGEAGFKLQNQLQAARQAQLSSQVLLSQAEEARRRGFGTEATQLATQALEDKYRSKKMAQDYQLGMAQINASTANANKNQNIEFYDWLSKNPKGLEAYREARSPQEKPLSDADILKSWDPLKYPGMTYTQYYAAMKNAGNMAPTSSLSASDQALVNKYAK